MYNPKFGFLDMDQNVKFSNNNANETVIMLRGVMKRESGCCQA